MRCWSGSLENALRGELLDISTACCWNVHRGQETPRDARSLAEVCFCKPDASHTKTLKNHGSSCLPPTLPVHPHTHTHTYGVSSFSDWDAGCRVGIKMPTVTVQYADLGVDATVHVGSRALPSVWNSYRNTLEVLLTACMLICVLTPLPARIQDLSKLI